MTQPVRGTIEWAHAIRDEVASLRRKWGAKAGIPYTVNDMAAVLDLIGEEHMALVAALRDELTAARREVRGSKKGS